MFATKPISPDSVAGALAKAERYRLLNEPGEAESICRDILEIEPDNQQALVSLILALTDQIPDDTRAFANASRPIRDFSRPTIARYYGGIAWERRAKARHRRGSRADRTSTNGSSRPCDSLRKPNGYALRATTTRSSAGTRAFAT